MANPFSNAPAGFPDTSDSGYAYWYAIGGDGLPVGVPRLVYDGSTFADEVEIELYQKRSKARDENLEAWRQAWDAEQHNGLFPATSITQEEAWHLRQLSMTRGDSIWYFACSGSNRDINALKNQSFYNPAPEGWRYDLDNTRFGDVPELWL
jgi:hypothetical protein